MNYCSNNTKLFLRKMYTSVLLSLSAYNLNAFSYNWLV